MWFTLKFFRKTSVVYLIIIIICSYFIFFSIVNFVEYLLRNDHLLIGGESAKNSKSPRNLQTPRTSVIIAHYIGSGNLFSNLSKEEQLNEYSPIPGEGENGNPVILPVKDTIRMQRLFQLNQYNLMASDRIALNRTLPEARKKMCISIKYPFDLPTTTIIIVFHNEAWSVLLRTVWSVINRSPKRYLKEIILVDDASTRGFLKENLTNYVKHLPVNTHVLRLPVRQGLIAARLFGAKYAKGEVLTFLDAHCECTNGWLEPLLNSVKENPNSIASPVIDIISDTNFGYIKSFELHSGIFNWNLHFRWILLPSNKQKSNLVTPFPTPVIAGGLFSIYKSYFFQMGGYDPKMKIWGGDNLEISFRIWQCGGSLNIVPCSHVAHLFRKSSPYTFPGGMTDILDENLARTALVWMDEYKNFVFKYNNFPNSLKQTLDIAERLELRRNLTCKNFNWYLSNIWPDNFLPSDDRFFGKIILVNKNSLIFTEYLEKINQLHHNFNWTKLIDFLNEFEGLWKNIVNGFCLQKPQNQPADTLKIPYGQATAKYCSDSIALSEIFVIKSNGQIMTDEGICLEVMDNNESAIVRIVTCTGNSNQLWKYNTKTQQIIHQNTKDCLTVTADIDEFIKNPNLLFITNTNKFDLYIRQCMADHQLQKWILMPLKWK